MQRNQCEINIFSPIYLPVGAQHFKSAKYLVKQGISLKTSGDTTRQYSEGKVVFSYTYF